jgi:cytochrome c biogenesis protein CcdA
MIQFYFLSVLLNALSGYVLITDNGEEDAIIDSEFRLSLHNETCRFILGILTIVMGLLKILSAIQGDVRVIGDFLPAVAGFLAGFILVFEYYRSRAALEPEHTEKIEQMLIHNKKWIGVFTLVVAGLHFLFPLVLFL